MNGAKQIYDAKEVCGDGNASILSDNANEVHGAKQGYDATVVRDAITILRKRLAGAKWRCGRARSYRQVAFDFPSPAIGARLLFDKLGPIPPGKSLDRIKSNGPYSLSNLRYASPLLQVLNRQTKSRVSHWMKSDG